MPSPGGGEGESEHLSFAGEEALCASVSVGGCSEILGASVLGEHAANIA